MKRRDIDMALAVFQVRAQFEERQLSPDGTDTNKIAEERDCYNRTLQGKGLTWRYMK